MELNRIELKKIMYDFNSVSNRLMQANIDDYISVLLKFIRYIENDEIIWGYINSCGKCTQNMEKEFKEVSESFGSGIFSLGDTDDEEVRNIYAILKYLEEHKGLLRSIIMGYDSSRKYQDMLRSFNKRVTYVLIIHIESYLTKIGIDMGVDETVKYNISVQTGQVNIAENNSSITATSSIRMNNDQIDRLIEKIKDISKNMPKEEKELINGHLNTIKSEMEKQTPEKSLLKTTISTLKYIKSGTEFLETVKELEELIRSVIGY